MDRLRPNTLALIVDDEPDICELLEITLSRLQIGSRRAMSLAQAYELLKRYTFDLCLTDLRLPDGDGIALVAHIQKTSSRTPVAVITAHGSMETAIQALKGGAFDFITKPIDLGGLRAVVGQALRISERRPEAETRLIGDSEAMRAIRATIAKLARSQAPVYISGESGTGKEVLARYIHQQSPRAGRPFIAINCAAIPDNMLEATLFGHEKGAFTGAIAAQPGKFELAEGGTILLDEISEMPLGLQAKLLRVLQEREVERVGARKPIELDIRVLATTNRELAGEVAAGRFREDLYYRLSVFPLAWRPLRERTADILPLAERLLAKHVKKMNHPAVRFSPQAQACLIRHPWPGNVRELDNAIQRALILQQGGLIQPHDLCLDAPIGMAPLAAVAAPLLAVVPGGAPSLPESPLPLAEAAGALGEDLRRREFQLIIDILRAERGRRKEAAERLGISPRTLRYKLAQMRDAGMDVEAYLFAS
ncbi:MAG: sigma-54-dependent transcriptional regulator [Pseudomonas sp.]